jgi:hypothetical protein
MYISVYYSSCVSFLVLGLEESKLSGSGDFHLVEETRVSGLEESKLSGSGDFHLVE